MPANGVQESALLTRARARGDLRRRGVGGGARWACAMSKPWSARVARAHPLRQQHDSSERGRAQRLSFGAGADRRPHGARQHQPPGRGIHPPRVEEAIAITRLQAPDPELLPLRRARRVRRAGALLRQDSGDDAGRAGRRPCEKPSTPWKARRRRRPESTRRANRCSRILNSRGVFAYHAETMAQFSITAMARTAPVGRRRAPAMRPS